MSVARSKCFYFFIIRKERFGSHPCEWPFILVHEITRQILLFLSLQLIYTFVATSIYLNSFLAASANYKPFPLPPFSMVLESSIPSDLYNSTPPYVFPARSKSMPSLRVPTNLVPSFSPFISMYTWTYPLLPRAPII